MSSACAFCEYGHGQAATDTGIACSAHDDEHRDCSSRCRKHHSKVELEPAHDELPASLLVSVATGPDSQHLVIPTPFTDCGNFEKSLNAITGAETRLVLAQAFCEDGEDEFSRRITAAVIDVGTDGAAARVLWRGAGTYRDSFGVCEQLDVPAVDVTGPGKANVVRITGVLAQPNPSGLGGGHCVAVPARRRRIAQLRF